MQPKEVTESGGMRTETYESGLVIVRPAGEREDDGCGGDTAAAAGDGVRSVLGTA